MDSVTWCSSFQQLIESFWFEDKNEYEVRDLNTVFMRVLKKDIPESFNLLFFTKKRFSLRARLEYHIIWNLHYQNVI